MPPQAREWSVPAPVRGLLWWPALSFLLVIVVPDAAIGSIVAAGAALAGFGALLSAVARRLQRTRPAAEAQTLEFGPLDLSGLEDDPRAA
jgi:hypothetical protein